MKRLAIVIGIGSLIGCRGGDNGTAPTPPANVAGPYEVHVTASSSCSANLPADARSLLFISTVTQAGASIQMELVGHQGGMANVSGTVSGRTVSFPSLSLSETMGRGATFTGSGTADVGTNGSLTGTLNGTYQTPAGSSCTAANHQLEMIKLCPQATATGSALVPCA